MTEDTGQRESTGDLINAFNSQRDILRDIELRISAGLGHTERPAAERKRAVQEAKIRVITDELSERYENELSPAYTAAKYGVVAAVAKVSEARELVAIAEGEVLTAREQATDAWDAMKSASRGAGKDIGDGPSRQRPKVAAGQRNTYGIGVQA